jgi:hypothetical protein
MVGVLQMALKIAELGHYVASPAACQYWMAALEEEMFQQGDAELAGKLHVSPLCDRTKAGISSAQVTGQYKLCRATFSLQNHA